VMFAAVASEAWARTGAGRKAVDTLDLFNPEAPDMGELRTQLWRSRAFAYAAVNDTKGIARAVKKLADINPHLLGMFVGQKKVGELKGMVTQLGKFALCGEGLNVGRDGGAPVTDDYPGSRPWAFSGGTIKQVVVDVSGEEYHDFEMEVQAMMSRD